MRLSQNARTISLYVPERARKQSMVERLVCLSEARDRSVNYLVIEAILQYIDREET